MASQLSSNDAAVYKRSESHCGMSGTDVSQAYAVFIVLYDVRILAEVSNCMPYPAIPAFCHSIVQTFLSLSTLLDNLAECALRELTDHIDIAGELRQQPQYVDLTEAQHWVNSLRLRPTRGNEDPYHSASFHIKQLDY